MRRSRRLALLRIGAAGTLVALALTVPATRAATNPIANPGFETGSRSSWTYSGGSVVGTPVHSGGFALAGAASATDDAQCAQIMAVAANTNYTRSAYVNGAYVVLGVSGAVSASTWTPGTAGPYQPLSVTLQPGRRDPRRSREAPCRPMSGTE